MGRGHSVRVGFAPPAWRVWPSWRAWRRNRRRACSRSRGNESPWGQSGRSHRTAGGQEPPPPPSAMSWGKWEKTQSSILPFCPSQGKLLEFDQFRLQGSVKCPRAVWSAFDVRPQGPQEPPRVLNRGPCVQLERNRGKIIGRQSQAEIRSRRRPVDRYRGCRVGAMRCQGLPSHRGAAVVIVGTGRRRCRVLGIDHTSRAVGQGLPSRNEGSGVVLPITGHHGADRCSTTYTRAIHVGRVLGTGHHGAADPFRPSVRVALGLSAWAWGSDHRGAVDRCQVLPITCRADSSFAGQTPSPPSPLSDACRAASCQVSDYLI